MFQREYYATHQCFLSHRSLYIAMWKVTDGEQGVNGIEPWLLNIQVCFLLSVCLLSCSSPFLGLQANHPARIIIWEKTLDEDL